MEGDGELRTERTRQREVAVESVFVLVNLKQPIIQSPGGPQGLVSTGTTLLHISCTSGQRALGWLDKAGRPAGILMETTAKLYC